MSVEQVHLCIDVSRSGDTITGTVTVGDGEVRKFSGRLGLFSTIDDEIERIGPDPRQAPAGQRPDAQPAEVQSHEVQSHEVQSDEVQEESEDDDR